MDQKAPGGDSGLFDALRRGESHDPHSVLGVHPARRGRDEGVVVRSYHPDASGCELLRHTAPAVEMTPLGPNRYLYHSEFFYQFLEKQEAMRLLESAGLIVGRNRLMHWEEEAHPEFRGSVHQHTSRVFLAQTPAR